MNFSCPSCGKPLVSRHSPLCNHCGAHIPAAVGFTEEEKKRIEADEQKTKDLLQHMEAERAKKAKEAWDAMGRLRFPH